LSLKFPNTPVTKILILIDYKSLYQNYQLIQHTYPQTKKKDWL